MLEWRKIEGFENYEVSNEGEVRNANTGNILCQKTDKYGYYQIGLYKDSKPHWKLVHRLVALTFIDNPENKPQVNHKDFNKKNNKISNLEWTTALENVKHAIDGGRYEKNGVDSKNSKAIMINELNLTFTSKRECAKYINKRFYRSTKRVASIEAQISKVLSPNDKKHYTAYGFTYKYI